MTERKTEWRHENRKHWLVVGALALAGAALAACRPDAAGTRDAPVETWRGRVVSVAAAGAAPSDTGLTAVTPGATGPVSAVLRAGAEIHPGMRIVTDRRTRAKLAFDDGSSVTLDRATEVVVEPTPRALAVRDGAVIADVRPADGAPQARFVLPDGGEVLVAEAGLGAKLAIAAVPDRASVDVLRGAIELASGRARRALTAGEEGVVRDGTIDVAPAIGLAQRTEFGESFVVEPDEGAAATVGGLGELRARRPGRADEKDHAVRLEDHVVKVRIAGNVARTEIDETFMNDTDDELEGIYRFPLPPGAQIERLALEVDGELVEGEFIDAAKASAIWRGALRNAAPKPPKPKEEIVWVPGPWHDPALLQWQRGGRFELRIFPIPKRASRRVVIAYTEAVTPIGGIRRYVYPLPRGSASTIEIGHFSLDVQVLGHDRRVPVRVHGYDGSTRVDERGAVHFTSSATGFVPTGDLALEYALEDDATDATAWAYAAATSPADDGSTVRGDLVGDAPFAAIALRPKLPRWSDERPRDQVVVVDVGRAMFGERSTRARRLAARIVEEMDRRDRVTVLACDVVCRALPGGFVAPGAPGAHDVDAFLRGIEPDGASDLVAAVRSAARVDGHDAGRDLRIMLLSDGVATAGYRSPSRIAAEVTDAVDDARAFVVTVPIGVDADGATLSEIARAGGGVTIPYRPEQQLASTALEILGATYGTMLRDVELTLPEGLRDAAPSALAPIRAGDEIVVTARMADRAVTGDVILRGIIGGDRFEARYPLELRATTDVGTAFIPRLFAAARIADLEREPGGGATTELVALSRRFAVPSRATSLLVLESEAMFDAFGIARAARAPRWTGEAIAQGRTMTAIPEASRAEEGPFDALDAEGFSGAFDARADGVGSAAPSSGAAMRRAPKAMAPSTLAKREVAPGEPNAPRPAPTLGVPIDRVAPPPRAPWGGGRFMKKVWVRRATTTATTAPPRDAVRLDKAREALASAPDERSKHRDLARLLAAAGLLEELDGVLARWSERDPLDVDAIVGRAELAARRGDRRASLRILGGALAASALTPSEAFTLADAVGRSYDRLGEPAACAFFVAAAELRAESAAARARAVACERARGRDKAAERWLEGTSSAQRRALEAAADKFVSNAREGTYGDIVVTARWTGGADLDVAIVDPAGRRAGSVTRLGAVRVEGATARDHETVALSTGAAGTFLVELVRVDEGEEGRPIRGTVTIRALGQTRTVPFTLAGSRAQAARVRVRWESELVPLEPTMRPAVAGAAPDAPRPMPGLIRPAPVLR